MGTRNLPLQLFRTTMILIAVSCAAAVSPRLAQAQDAARVSTSAPSATLPGPRLSSQFQRYEAPLAGADAPAGSSALVAGGGSHTIVISTLALVLIGVIIVLLI